MNALSWKLNRVRSMGVREIGYRIRKSVQARLEACGLGLAQAQVPSGTSGCPVAGLLTANVDPAPYLTAADRILSGRFRVFALDAELGFPPQWNRDCRTGILAPQSFGKRLNYRDERIVGDIKYLWEPNRHLELVTLAQAWRLSGNDKYADGAAALIGSWIDHNPYPLGPNWASSLEHAIRVINWSFAWHLLGADSSPLFQGPDGAAFRNKWLASIRQHLHFIAGHFSRYSSANNHLLGEYLGLLVGSLTWPMWRECPRWRAIALAGFEAEALRQNGPDGVNREQAVYYQHEVMDMMLLAGLVGRANGIRFSTAYWDRLERMTEFLAALMDVRGRVPMIGDADDAQIVRLDPSDHFDTYRSLIAAGALVFSRADLKAKAGDLGDKNRWLFGPGETARFEGLPSRPAAPRTSFPDGGYYLLGHHFDTSDEVRLIADCGPLGYLSIAAHGHADALSFTLSAFGTEWLIDPGTYAYHTQKLWREYFRGTGAHNTVRIDRKDQSVIGGNFMWLAKADARLVSHDPASSVQSFEGEHDGYMRLADPVRHRRRIEFDSKSGQVCVRDRLDCNSSHDVDISWHFGEECDVGQNNGLISARAGERTLTMACDAPGLVLSMLVGSEDPIGGWVSRSFDAKSPTATARWSGRISGSVDIVTTLRFR